MNTSTSVLDAIGSTPLVELSRFTRGLGGRLFVKLEYLNPGGSKKDRMARQVIEDAEADGSLKPGQSVVEMTSGNAGTGLAIVCAVKGYPFIAVMSRGNSIERVRMMRALGAEVVLVDQLPDSTHGQVSGGDLELVNQEAARIQMERGAFRADQFHHQGNFRAHYLHTAREILQQTGGKVDAFCDFVGSGGTFAGCAAAFKEHNPQIQCFVVEPSGCAVLAGNEAAHPNHKIQGGGYSIAPLPLIKTEHIDGYLRVTDEEAMEAARSLAKLEGIFGGFSSGANVAAAKQILEGRTVVTTINDSGMKYLSTELWE
ncbi:MAG TPA: cysteine synthase family protein [Alloacidobacterium sp.]|nr:cysteine synthase family protein [Alloacidobacterium sp.]